jgi:hypothetical protein
MLYTSTLQVQAAQVTAKGSGCSYDLKIWQSTLQPARNFLRIPLHHINK